MAYDETLASSVRLILSTRNDVVEKKMFGGLTFMISGHMCCGVEGTDLVARVGPNNVEKYLKIPNTRRMDFTGKPLKGFVCIAIKQKDDVEQLQRFIMDCLSFVASLPAK